MSADEQARFLQGLAEDVNSRNISLPSFPDVVIKIRTALEDPTCTPDRLSDVAKSDPVLVSRLLQSANSAFNNRAGIEIVDLNLAISRLGFEAVRNTAIALAVEQLFNASKHDELKDHLRAIWSQSVALSSMCYVLAGSSNLNPDNAFLCGLLHNIGKLYILTRARDFPDLLGNPDSLNAMMDQWHEVVGKSIVDAWGFPSEIGDSLQLEENMRDNGGSPPTLVDVVFVSEALVADGEAETDLTAPQFAKLKVNDDSLERVRESYELHASSMRQALGV